MKNKKTPATDIEVAAFTEVYEFAKRNCGHTVCARTVAAALGINKSAVFGCRNTKTRPNGDLLPKVTAEYTRQIAKFAGIQVDSVRKMSADLQNIVDSVNEKIAGL